MRSSSSFELRRRMLRAMAGVGLFVWTLLAVVVQAKVGAKGTSRPIQILNHSKFKVELYWIHPVTGERSLMSAPTIFPGADFQLDSFVEHAFVIQEFPTGKANKDTCTHMNRKKCRELFFEVTDNDDQLIQITEEFEIDFTDNKVKAHREAADLIEQCKAQALARVASATASADSQAVSKAMDDLVKCVEGGVAVRLERVNEEIAFQASVRTDIAAQLENYTCADDTLDSSEDVDTSSVVLSRQKYTVHVKHDRPASKIHVIENFIRPDECAAMEAAAAETLHRATVADGKGGSRLSENRKAMQAGIKVPWHMEKAGNPIARLSRRVYDYTNAVLNLNIQENGQEDLMSIQYFGRGMNDTEPDRYTPHCDGDCTGLPHKSGTRMATMVMYCTVASKGGHTNFRNAGVHVKPEPYNAIFFSYIDPVTRLMDTGFTEHSGCPVYEGEKKIVTQWIRLGVDDENPWDSFNTLGIKRSEMAGLEEDEPEMSGDDSEGEEEGEEESGNDEL